MYRGFNIRTIFLFVSVSKRRKQVQIQLYPRSSDILSARSSIESGYQPIKLSMDHSQDHGLVGDQRKEK